MEEQLTMIDKLAEGYSTQSKTVNKFWLVLLIASTISLTGHLEKSDGLIELPFTLGSVNPSDFYSICIVIISVMVIIFSSAMIQTFRTRMLIQRVIEQQSEKFIQGIHIQDYLDSILTPTYNRVAPISQYLLGKNQFLGDKNQSKFWRRLGVFFYILFKLTTFIFMYFFPAIALWKCYTYFSSHLEQQHIGIPYWILILVVFLAGVSALILFYADLKYLVTVSKKILK